LASLTLATGVLLSGAALGAKPRTRPTPRPATEAPPPSAPSAPAPSRPEKTERPEKGVAATTPKVTAAPASADVVATEEGKEGVKTYRFGAVEVESRLRSPQLIYFLRRVRAEFDAEGLGHRSFLRELSETQRAPAFR